MDMPRTMNRRWEKGYILALAALSVLVVLATRESRTASWILAQLAMCCGLFVVYFSGRDYLEHTIEEYGAGQAAEWWRGKRLRSTASCAFWLSVCDFTMAFVFSDALQDRSILYVSIAGGLIFLTLAVSSYLVQRKYPAGRGVPSLDPSDRA